MNHGWLKIFKCCLYFLNLNLCSLSGTGILLTCSGLDAIRGFREQRELKDSRLPFETALNVI
jgi:hypothetical protein